MSILQLLRSDGSIIVNKHLAKTIGLHETIILAELISWQLFYEDRNELDDEGMFFCTIDKLEDNTTLSKHQQNKAIKNLESLGIVVTARKGLPAKRYFRINEQNISSLLNNKRLKKSTTDNSADNEHKNERKPQSNQIVKKSPSSGLKINHTVGQKLTTINNLSINNQSINDDDDIVAVAHKIFKDKFKDILKDDRLQIVIDRIKQNKTRINDLEGYITKALQTELETQQSSAERSFLSNDNKYSKPKTHKRSFKRKIETVNNDDIPAQELTPDEIDNIKKMVADLGGDPKAINF